MTALSSGHSSNSSSNGGSLDPDDRRGFAEIAASLAEVAEASSVRMELAAALGIEGAAPSDLYELFVKELPPFASIYLSTDGNIGGDTRFVIAGFYTALGIPVPSDPDHLASLLRLLSVILNKEAELASAGTDPSNEKRLASVSRARSVLVADHLATWLPAYLLRAEEVAPSALQGWVSCALDLLSVVTGGSQGTVLPTEEHDNGNIASASSSEVINWITSPGCSGLIITPWDIRNLAESLGLAIRIGRKRFVLEELWAQAGQEVLVHLQSMAERQMKLFDENCCDFPSLKTWSTRAARTVESLAAKAKA